jgi:hypothetical protein
MIIDFYLFKVLHAHISALTYIAFNKADFDIHSE